ncbi:MAG TPA: hypothetical protein VF011_18740 [Terriglobales bacterium]
MARIMSWFFNVVPYALALGAIILGGVEIRKNWHEYKERWLKNTVATVFVIVGLLTIVSLRHDQAEKRKADEKAEQQMSALRAEARAANGAQKENTKLFTEWSKRMSDQVGDLKAEVKTEKLQKKLAEVQAELLKTQKAMAPGPKAELAFTFFPFTNPPPPAKPVLSKQVTLPLDSDGSVHVDLTAVNPTEVDATDGEINLRICDRCKFAKEPERFARMKGWGETVRFAPFTNIHAMEAFRTITLEVIPPEDLNRIPISFAYRCHTCVLQVGSSDATSGSIYIIRSGLRMKTTVPAKTRSQ